MLASIPYRTFPILKLGPILQLGPIPIRVFGVFVAIGILVGSWVFLRFARERGMDPEALTSLAWRVIVLGIAGSRVTFVLTHLSDFTGRPLSMFALWEGGLQFSGAFLLSIVVIVWWGRTHREVDARALTDGIVLGLVPGLMIGRIGCYAVGEHLGKATTFFLGTKYLGGETREGPIAIGTVIHNTALYELLLLAPLAAILFRMARRRTPTGAMTATFLLWYGAQRFLTDVLRAYDERVAGLTGAQYICLGMIAAGLVLTWRARPGSTRLAEA